MPSKLMMIYVAFDVIFAGCGGLLMAFSLMAENTMRASPTLDNVARNLLLDQCPLTGTMTRLRRQKDPASIYYGATVAPAVLRCSMGQEH